MIKARFHCALETERHSDVPGDTALVLTDAAKDSSGRTWPEGTLLVPLCGGFDNEAGSRYQDVTITGEVSS